MAKTIFLLIGTIIIAISSVLIFDARLIAAKSFNSGEINEATKTLKIVGAIFSFIGLMIIYINI